MGKGLIVVVVIILFLAGAGITAYSLFTAISVIPRITNTDFSVPTGTLTIRDAYYHTGIDSLINCSKEREIVILRYLHDQSSIAGRCQVLIDNTLIRDINVPDICQNCSEILENLALPAQKMTQSHKIEVCCRDICDSYFLKAEC